MRVFTIVLKVLASVPVLVGLSHLLMGLGSDALLGAKLPLEVLSDPVLDSQNRFYGVIFIGYGILIFLCASDVRKYSSVLRIVASFIFLGGFGRLVSIALFGLPTLPIIALTAVELVGVPLLLWWHFQILQQS